MQLRRSSSSVTPENVMKWEVVQPERDRYDFAEADKLVTLRRHHQKVRGHTLVWHNQLPAWLTAGTWTKQEPRRILREHIKTEVRHFQGTSGRTATCCRAACSSAAASPSRCGVHRQVLMGPQDLPRRGICEPLYRAVRGQGGVRGDPS